MYAATKNKRKHRAYVERQGLDGNYISIGLDNKLFESVASKMSDSFEGNKIF